MANSSKKSGTMTRRQVLGAAAAGAGAALTTTFPSAARAGRAERPMNVLIFLSDQERAVQHFPRDWVKRNLPGMYYLQQTGLTFNRAFCSSCMCSPSRASLMSGYFPAQHEVTDTLSFFGDDVSNSQKVLSTDLPNLATVTRAAGYQPVFKGKTHWSKPLSDPQSPLEAHFAWKPSDISIYGFDRWNPPDAGEDQSLYQFGGGRANNDGRYMLGRGSAAAGYEGTLQYLQQAARKQQPFFTVVSLVNPHDVLSYWKTWAQGGYHGQHWLKGQIQLPATWQEDLSDKPTAQSLFLIASALGLGPLVGPQMALDYLNFYANLMKRTDDYLCRMLQVMANNDLLDDTLIIRTADHGEMGLTHNGQRQKMFNFYEETMRVPLIFSNPRLYRKPAQTDALVSHVDLLPTIASLVNAPDSARTDWEGVDYSSIVRNPAAPPVQDYVAFTFDDVSCGQDTPRLLPAPTPDRIVSIREERFKLAKYYDKEGGAPDQWEMYDLLANPLETDNLAWPGATRTQEQTEALVRLTAKLAEVEQTRLQPLPTP